MIFQDFPGGWQHCQCHHSLKLQMTFMGLDLEANKPRMNAELRVMMADCN